MPNAIKTITTSEATTAEIHKYLLSIVAPRPIAFASTISKNGAVNLSPFSFFNVFSANPPILIFSPARRVSDNTTKHTLDNILEHAEVVINIANYSMVTQLSLSSTAYAFGVNEFVKSGLTEVPSDLVKPPRVGEAPAALECKVNQVIPLGDQGGAGNLVIAEVLKIHIKEAFLDANQNIDPYTFDAIARMGDHWYCRVVKEAIFEIPKPIRTLGIGVDQLPESVKNSTVLNGNDLGRLGNAQVLPSPQAVLKRKATKAVLDILENTQETAAQKTKQLHQLAKNHLELGALEISLEILMCAL